MLPAKKRRGSPTGGGNFYIFKSGRRRAQQAAAFNFIKWMTAPERAARMEHRDRLCRGTRPTPRRPPAMKKYVADFPPAAVARDQLKYAVAELSTHDNQRVHQGRSNDAHAGRADRHQDARAGDEGRAGAKPTASAQALQVSSAAIGQRPARAGRSPIPMQRHTPIATLRTRTSMAGCCCCRRPCCWSPSRTGRRSPRSGQLLFDAAGGDARRPFRRPRQLRRPCSATRCSGRR